MCAEEAMVSGATRRGNCVGLATTEKRHGICVGSGGGGGVHKW